MSIDLNKLAQRVTQREAGEKEVDIAQTKEIIRIVLEELACQPHGSGSTQRGYTARA